LRQTCAHSCAPWRSATARTTRRSDLRSVTSAPPGCSGECADQPCPPAALPCCCTALLRDQPPARRTAATLSW
jgi:hypothetical protein